ncbi:methyltransferase domain-containing protein [Candidatus Woesearchaeota archaeon]|nr:MAG: methyltransferase domain-containing protein [Candidatus Woesearchaeota archaeon]
MARIVIKLPRTHREKKIGVREYFVRDEQHDFHTDFGVLPKEALAACGKHRVGNETVLVYPATFADAYARLQRGVQIVVPKDLGLVIATTGIGPESVVLDIGFGSGAVTGFLARLVKHVYAYDRETEHITLGEENLKNLGITNFTVKKGDAYDASTIAEEGVCDLFFLDVPEPWRALATAKKALKPGAWLVAYTPCITQVTQLADALGDDWHKVKCVEVIEREWKTGGLAVRPITKDFSHTAFLTFLRNIP